MAKNQKAEPEEPEEPEEPYPPTPTQAATTLPGAVPGTVEEEPYVAPSVRGTSYDPARQKKGK